MAKRMSPLLGLFFGGEVPVRFVFWDGSALGRQDGPGTVVLRSDRVLTRLVWSPDELGLARSFVAGDIDLDGCLYDILATLHESIRRARPAQPARSGERPVGCTSPRGHSPAAPSTPRGGSPDRMASFAASRCCGDQASL